MEGGERRLSIYKKNHNTNVLAQKREQAALLLLGGALSFQRNYGIIFSIVRNGMKRPAA